MAFRFNAILNFASQKAEQSIESSKKKFQNLKDSIGKANESLAKMGAGATAGAAALSPLTIGTGFAIKEAADFEQGLSAVQSVMLATKEEMKPLASVTKMLGATTKFTAFEATEGAKFLAQAGFSMTDVIGALPGVLDAAAASEISLADASNIVAANVNAFGLKATQATEVADALALTTSLTNTNMIELGEGLKFVAPFAKLAGMSIQDTSSALGVLANAGVKGSLGGTALKNALLKLATPTEKAIALFGSKGGLASATKDAQGNLLPLEVIMANVSKVIANKAGPDKLEAIANAAEIFGLRGTTAFGGFQSALLETVPVTEIMRKRLIEAGEVDLASKDQIPKLVALRMQIKGAAGSAKEMAAIRLDNLKGQFTLFQSATSGALIELGSLFTGPMQNGLKLVTDALSVLTIGFQLFGASQDEIGASTKLFEEQGNAFVGFLPMAIEFAAGVRNGISELWDTGSEVFGKIVELVLPFFDGIGMTAGEIGKLAAKIAVVGAIAAPVLAAVAAASFILPPIFGAMSGAVGLAGAALSALGVVLSPIGLIVGVLAVALWQAAGGFEGIKNFIFQAWDALKAFGDGFMTTFMPIITQVGEELMPTFNGIVGVFKEFLGTIFGDTGAAGIEFQSFGETVGNVLGFILTATLPLIKGLGKLIQLFGKVATFAAGKTVGAIKGIAGFLGFGDENKDEIANNVIPIRNNLDVVANSAQIAEQTTKQKAIVQPPSAQEVSNAFRIANGNAGTSSGGGGQSNVNVVVGGEFRLRGSDLNMVVTKSKMENTQLNGKPIQSTEKRRNHQNGEQF